MASIEAKQIHYKDKEEMFKYSMMAVRAWNTLNRVRKNDDYEFVNSYIEAYKKKKKTTSGPFLKRTEELLKEHSEEYNGLNEKDKKIVAIITANKIGVYLQAKSEISTRVG